MNGNRMMQEMAKHPNVYCKLSGLFTEAKWKQWSAAEFYPYLDVVFEAFGTDRLDIWQRLAGNTCFRYLCAMEKFIGKVHGEFQQRGKRKCIWK